MEKSDRMLTRGRMAWLIVIAILIIDQLIKIHVKTTMALGESHEVTSWFYIYFIENRGMAWGMTFISKLFLSLLRVAAVTAIGWYIWLVCKQRGRWIYVLFLSWIVAGAAGNILDSAFYGLVFSESTPYSVSVWVPFGEGYAPFLKGSVVDMFYFPIIDTTWPSWMPWVGGERFVFFSPIFNFADAAITTGVCGLLVFCSKDFATIGDTVKAALHRNGPDAEKPNDNEKDG